MSFLDISLELTPPKDLDQYLVLQLESLSGQVVRNRFDRALAMRCDPIACSNLLNTHAL